MELVLRITSGYYGMFMECDSMIIKVSYDEEFRVSGIGNQENFITNEPFILMDLTDEEYEYLLDTPFKTLMVDIEYNTVVSALTLEEPMEEVNDVEYLKKENDELKERLAKIETLLNI